MYLKPYQWLLKDVKRNVDLQLTEQDQIKVLKDNVELQLNIDQPRYNPNNMTSSQLNDGYLVGLLADAFSVSFNYIDQLLFIIRELASCKYWDNTWDVETYQSMPGIIPIKLEKHFRSIVSPNYKTSCRYLRLLEVCVFDLKYLQSKPSHEIKSFVSSPLISIVLSQDVRELWIQIPDFNEYVDSGDILPLPKPNRFEELVELVESKEPVSRMARCSSQYQLHIDLTTKKETIVHTPSKPINIPARRELEELSQFFLPIPLEIQMIPDNPVQKDKKNISQDIFFFEDDEYEVTTRDFPIVPGVIEDHEHDPDWSPYDSNQNKWYGTKSSQQLTV